MSRKWAEIVVICLVLILHVWGTTYKRMGHYLHTSEALPIHVWGTWSCRGTRKCSELIVQCSESIAKCPESIVQCSEFTIQCSELILMFVKHPNVRRMGRNGRNMFEFDRTRMGHIGHYLYTSGALGALLIHVGAVVQYSELILDCL